MTRRISLAVLAVCSVLTASQQAHALSYTCAEAADFAQKVYDTKKEGHSLSDVLRAISQNSGGDIQKETLLQGIAMAIWGDRTLTRQKAYSNTYEACSANKR